MEDLLTSEQSNREYLNTVRIPRHSPCPHCHNLLEYGEAQSNGGVHEQCFDDAYKGSGLV